MNSPITNDIAHEPAPLGIEEHLYCTGCGYDIIGLSESRCPECGLEFDVDELRTLYGKEPQAAVPWDAERSFGSFWQTWWLTARDPGRSARQFPRVHLRESSAGYSRTASFAAVAVFLITA